MTESDTHTLHVNKRAVDTIVKMGNHVQELALYFGPEHNYTTDASLSLNNNLTKMFSTFFGGDTHVTRDSELSLFVQSKSGFVYGLIFHGHRRMCTVETCKAWLADAESVGYSYTDGAVLCGKGNHTPDIPFDAPDPGTWSFHS
jgi:hypothetical protein